MKIKRLYIKDFGVFYNQLLEDICPGIVVVGGLNRAGKTTLLEIIRHFGYGFPQGVSLPPARNKYELEGDVLLEDGDTINLQLNGYSEPIINYISGNDKSTSLKQLYNNIDYFTYKELFTITLDELKMVPKGVNKKEIEKLQSILLGAGLSDILLLPQLEEYFTKEAEKIGGKNGDQKVKDFKPYYQQIVAGLEIRNEALKQVDLFQEKNVEIKNIEEEIAASQDKIADLELQITLLDVLKNNYTDISQFKKQKSRLEQPEINNLLTTFPVDKLDKVNRLRENYQSTIQRYEELLQIFKHIGDSGEVERIIDIFIKHKEELVFWQKQLSGLKVKINNYFKLSDELKKEERELVVDLKLINDEWTDDFSQIMSLETDVIDQHKLHQEIEEFKDINERIRQVNININELTNNERELEREIDFWQKEDSSPTNKSLLFWGVVLLLVGTGLSFVNFWLGLLGISGLPFLGFYFSHKKNYRRHIQDLQYDLHKVQGLLNDKKNILKEEQEEIKPLENHLQIYRYQLGLIADSSPELIKDYFRDVQILKKRIAKLNNNRDLVKKECAESKADLMKISSLLADFSLLFSVDLVVNAENILNNYQILFVQLEEVIDSLNLALNLAEQIEKKNEIEEEISSYLGFAKDDDLLERLDSFMEKGARFTEYQLIEKEYQQLKLQLTMILKTERVSKAFQKFVPLIKSDLISGLVNVYDKFTSKEDVEKNYKKSQAELNMLLGKLEDLKNNAQSLKDVLKRLATTDKLEKAQLMIDEGRTGLRPLAEKYAVYRSAAFILQSMRKKFMDEMQDTLLDKASKYFSKITGGEYTKILPADKLTEPNFQLILQDGDKQSAEILSRGTQEELFLAMRINRIKEITPSLPVIVDDSLINFDSYHLYQTVDILCELAQTHQIFFLTCHPHLIKAFAEQSSANIQYWQLQKGKFSLTDAERLRSYLQVPLSK